MNLTFRLGRKAPASGQEAPELPPIASGVDQVAAHLGARVASAALVACLALAPVGVAMGGWALLQQSAASAAPPLTASGGDRANDRAIAGEFARTVTVTWLTTSRDKPDALVALIKSVQVSSLPQQAFRVANPAVAGITEVDPVTWSVTVAVDVTDTRDATVRRFYQVPVQTSRGAVVALALPAPVSAPQVSAAPANAYRDQVSLTGAAGQTVTQFLGAYSAGQGDISRYLTPGVSLQPITPAPYTTVRLNDLRAETTIREDTPPADRQQARVLATVTAAVTDQQSVPAAYALTLTARAGRWEVTAVDPAPALFPRKTTAATASGAAPSPGTPQPSVPGGAALSPTTPNPTTTP